MRERHPPGNLDSEPHVGACSGWPPKALVGFERAGREWAGPTRRHGMNVTRIAAVIVAAGRGSRAGSALGAPKQYLPIGGKAVLAHTVRCFLGHPRIATVQVVIHPEDRDSYGAAIAGLTGPLRPPVPGGATRQDSVRCGLEALAGEAPDLVLVHDAARPFLDADVIDRVVGALADWDGVVPALAVADTIKRTDAKGRISGTVDRAGLWRAQTPQGFAFAPLLAAHRAAAEAGRSDFTDDAALAEWRGLTVTVVPGSERNRKITTAEDIVMAEREFAAPRGFEAVVPDVRTGTGFDVHRFAPGDHVWLGGVRIPHSARLEGHSDADVALHALTDALLGAIGDGDIGKHFPPSDARWKGAASHLFLADAARRVNERGGRISNVDLTILCEAPRVGPHREAMRTEIARILRIDVDRVGVKATTTEGLGFTGRREGIAAMATATVILP
jgi:2-C-methyl-D-erythritol 4-phosphate cytidylyltransferase/2-C-methyl-D-erythritol 2,4-cyclodiphosphate synthase